MKIKTKQHTRLIAFIMSLAIILTLFPTNIVALDETIAQEGSSIEVNDYEMTVRLFTDLFDVIKISIAHSKEAQEIIELKTIEAMASFNKLSAEKQDLFIAEYKEIHTVVSTFEITVEAETPDEEIAPEITENNEQLSEPYFEGNHLFAVGLPILLLNESEAVNAYWDKNGNGDKDEGDTLIVKSSSTTQHSNWTIYGGAKSSPMTSSDSSQITLLCGGFESVNAGSMIGGDVAADVNVNRTLRIGTKENYPEASGFNLTEYKITFDSQEGSFEVSFLWQAKNQLMKEHHVTPPTKKDYTFAGFFDAIMGGTQYYREDMKAAVPIFTESEPITLYAKWNVGAGIFAGRFSQYQVFDCKRFPSFPESNEPFKASSFDRPYNDTSGYGYQMTATEVANKIFYFKKSGDSYKPFTLYMADDVDGLNEKVISGNGNIHALGREGFLFTSIGSEKGYFISLSQGFEYGEEITYIPTEKGPISEETGTNVSNISPTPWNPDDSYSITFDSQGADVAATPSQISVRKYPEPALMGDLPTIPVKSGFEFSGWNTSIDGTGEVIENHTKITRNIAVYAQWTALEITDVKINEKPQVNYSYNDNFNPEGLKITVTYKNGSTKDVSYSNNEALFDIMPSVGDQLTLDSTEVIITYMDNEVAYPLVCPITVKAKELSQFKVDVSGKTYDGTKAASSGVISAEGIVEKDVISIRGDVNFVDKHVGKNKQVLITNIQIEGQDAKNYSVSNYSIEVETIAQITAKSIDVLWSGQNDLIYTGEPKNVTATIDEQDIANGDECHIFITGGTETNYNAENYRATARLSNNDYSINNDTMDYAIAKAPLTVKFKDQTIKFGETADLNVDVTGFVGRDTAANSTNYRVPTIKTILPTAVSEIPYTIVLNDDGTAQNYHFILKEGYLTINKSEMNDLVKAENYVGVYDGANHGITVTAPEGSTITYKMEGVSTDNKFVEAGSYTVNYTVTHNSHTTVKGKATVEISKKTLVPSLNLSSIQGKTYDKTTKVDLLDKSILLAGLISGDDITASATVEFVNSDAGVNKRVDVYDIVLSNSRNYELSMDRLLDITTTVSIDPLEAKLTWDTISDNLIYDGTIKHVAASVSNLISDDSCAVTIEGDSAIDTGDHTAYATELSNSNYKLPTKDVVHTFTITPATITDITIEPTIKTYDGVFSEAVKVLNHRASDVIWYSTTDVSGTWSQEVPLVGVEGSTTDIWVKVEREHYYPFISGKVSAIVNNESKILISKPQFDTTDVKMVTVGGMVIEGGNTIVTQSLELREMNDSKWTLLKEGVKVGNKTTYEETLNNLKEYTEYELKLTATDKTGKVIIETLKFRTQAENPPIGEIIGGVTGGSGYITVTLEAGDTVVASIDKLKSDDTFSFKSLADGEYNLVATDAVGRHVTMHASVKDSKTTVLTTMTIGLQQSAVVIKGEAPPVAIGGLQELFESKTYKDDLEAVNNVTNGGTAEIRLTANEAHNSLEMDEITASGTYGVTIMIDIKVDMIITPNGLPSITKNLNEVDGLLTIAVPLPKDVIDDKALIMKRFHNGKVETLREITNEADKAEGTFLVLGNYIYVFSSKFSTYAITHSNPINGGGSGSNGSSGSGNDGTRFYNILLKAGVGGTFIPNKSELYVQENDRLEVKIVADEGYVINEVKVNGQSIGAVDTYIEPNIQSDYKITATFKEVKPNTPEIPEEDIENDEPVEKPEVENKEPDEIITELIPKHSPLGLIVIGVLALGASMIGIMIILLKRKKNNK